MKTAGDKILIKADDVLGTSEAMATIVTVHETFYTVHIDGEGPNWFGSVTFDGVVLCEDAQEDDHDKINTQAEIVFR